MELTCLLFLDVTKKQNNLVFLKKNQNNIGNQFIFFTAKCKVASMGFKNCWITAVASFQRSIPTVAEDMIGITNQFEHLLGRGGVMYGVAQNG